MWEGSCILVARSPRSRPRLYPGDPERAHLVGNASPAAVSPGHAVWVRVGTESSRHAGNRGARTLGGTRESMSAPVPRHLRSTGVERVDLEMAPVRGVWPLVGLPHGQCVSSTRQIQSRAGRAPTCAAPITPILTSVEYRPTGCGCDPRRARVIIGRRRASNHRSKAAPAIFRVACRAGSALQRHAGFRGRA